MKRKMRWIAGFAAFVLILLVCSVPSLADRSVPSKMTEWGNVLKKYADRPASLTDDIYAEGSTAFVTNQEIDQAAEFYLLSESDETAAREKAISYMKEREALYSAAIRNGYTATDEEVHALLNELKDRVHSADNKEDAEAVIAAFGSEEAYWDYEFTIYQKDLPIQKYVKGLQTAYAKEKGLEQGSEAFIDGWNDYYNNFKKNLVLAENYKVVQ